MTRLRWVSLVCALALAAPSAQQRSIDDFFRELSDGWVRLNPNLAVATRYFAATNDAEQNLLEQQLSSYSDAAEHQRREYLSRGLAELTRFDRARMSDSQRLSADLLRYQLQAYLDSARYDDY